MVFKNQWWVLVLSSFSRVVNVFFSTADCPHFWARMHDCTPGPANFCYGCAALFKIKTHKDCQNQTVHHVDTNGSKTTSAHLEIQKCCKTHARLIGGSNGPIMHVCRCTLLLGTLRKDVITTWAFTWQRRVPKTSFSGSLSKRVKGSLMSLGAILWIFTLAINTVMVCHGRYHYN